MKQKITRSEDLASSQLPWYIAAFNHYCDSSVNRYVKLSVSDLLKAAKRKTKLVDFGETNFLKPLHVLVLSLESEAHLSAVERLTVREYLIQLLVNRLRIEDLIKRYPIILDEQIDQPVIVSGLPNASTPRIFNLLALDRGFRTLSYWESMEPVSTEKDRAKIGERDPRIKRAQRSRQLLEKVLPDFRAMNQHHRSGPHEESQLLALNFSSPLFESYYNVPSYGAWYKNSDRDAAFFYLKRVLQVLQWQRGGKKRWVLKTSQQPENMSAMSRIFPTAKYIQAALDSAEDGFAVIKQLYQFLQHPLSTETVIDMQRFIAENPSGSYANNKIKRGKSALIAESLGDSLKVYQKQIQLI